MRYLRCTLAMGLLSTAVDAAPRLRDGREPRAYYEALKPRHDTSEPTGTPTAMPEDCPADTQVISTTTVDVTVYVTLGVNATHPCTDGTSTLPPTGSYTNTQDGILTTSTAAYMAPTKGQGTNTTMTTGSEPCETDTAMLSAANGYSTTEPCTDERIAALSATSSTPFDPTSTAAMYPQELMAAESTNTDTATDTATAMYLATTRPTQTTATCIIDTTMAPVARSALPSTYASPAKPTRTICEHNHETGKPSPENAYCGIKGEPAGTYFIAGFIEERPGVPVSEEGCYQFCDSVMEDTKGCQSYRYYHNDLGAPRCDLYGMPVSFVVENIDRHQPGRWYDLECGSPIAKPWHSRMPPMYSVLETGATSSNATAASTAAPAASTAYADVTDNNSANGQYADEPHYRPDGKRFGHNDRRL
ncbi:hypothetical protein DCS_03908 [Drechmeria coniospora]|uniref:Apple domain-containing protein n=1 Tax=Drechmeria coniospora TaxID=98403 RepID=A0A151GIP7_DRECN|nr:hypothetical protein DCS_03908 [Drechmeria coniospora]KYK56902.1 hypothetical protein DCS_03908 [Drechmeria coniospora]